MAEHGNNYQRTMGKDKDDKPIEVGSLGPACGHHCGVITVGAAHPMVKHCSCAECHKAPEVSSAFTDQTNTGMDPRSIS